VSEQISSDLPGYWRRHLSQPGEQQEELLHEYLSQDIHEKWDHRLKFLAGGRIMPAEWLLGRDGRRKMSW